MTKNKEIWKDVVGYEGLYEVSNLGRVRTIKDKTDNNYHYKSINPIGAGYLSCILSKDGKLKTKYIHRLVCEAFIPNPDNKSDVNHKNGDKTLNVVDNLEWTTRYENMQHAIENGFMDKFLESARKNGKDHIKSKRVKATHDDGSVQYFDNGRICAEELSINYNSLRSAMHENRKIQGYTLEHVEKEI